MLWIKSVNKAKQTITDTDIDIDTSHCANHSIDLLK